MGNRSVAEKSEKKGRVLVWLVVLAAVALICLAAPVVYETFIVKIPAEVSIGGLPLGDLSGRDARLAIQNAQKTLLTKELTLALPDEKVTIPLENLSLDLDRRAMRRDAAKAETGSSLSLEAYLQYNADPVYQALTAWSQEHDSVLIQPTWTCGEMPELEEGSFDPDVPCPELAVTLGTPERHLDVAGAMDKVAGALHMALGGGDLTVTLEVPASEEPQKPNLEEICAEACPEPQDASLDMQTYEPIPGAYGCSIDMAEAEKQIAEAQYGETVTLPMHYVEPEILKDGVYFRDELGVCETKHNDDENRNTNLRLICEELNGHVIQPGEEFSFNDVVGERSPERGYKPATVFSGDHIAKDYGGGACQTSSTLYNCALLADLEITDRRCHGAIVTYLPLGLDATVNWATNTDFKFRNSSHFPIQIEAKMEDGYVKMKILGTDEKDYYVKMETNQWDDAEYAYATSYKCKYDKETDEQISRDLEARSSYIKELG